MFDQFFHHYESKGKPLAAPAVYWRRQRNSIFFAFVLMLFSLALGMAGYHWLENISWIDALLNASMILTGMGPVNEMQTFAGKLFASFYALYSGVAFLTFAGVLFAPMYHRFIHKFHLLDENDVNQG